MSAPLSDRFSVLWPLAAGGVLRRDGETWRFRTATVSDSLVQSLASEGDITIEADGICKLTDQGSARFLRTVKDAQLNCLPPGRRSSRKRG
jgi:hypothetical protein